MNNPIRYNLNTVVGIIDEDECGKYVLYSDYEELKEGNDCLGQMHDKEMERSAYLLEEFNRTTAWGRGLESDLSHARVEISFLKAEVERLKEAWVDKKMQEDRDALLQQVERLRKAGDALSKFAMHNDTSSELWIAWQAAKEGKPS